MSVLENIKKVRNEIAEVAEKTGQKADNIMLVAATKTQDAQTVRQAIAGGVDACGENRVQELIEKNAENAYNGAPIHFIGHLQKNKLKKVVGTVELIQSVDSFSLVEAINNRALEIEIIQDILIEVNIGNDPAKYGVSPDEINSFLEKCEECSGIKVRGLMTILPNSSNSYMNRSYFANLHKVFVDIRAKTYDNISMDYLSMGMSGDFREAILEGANMVRIGSSLFGERN